MNPMNASEPREDAVADVMTKAQEFASSWSLVGGPFDDGTMLAEAEARQSELRALVAALAQQGAEPVAAPKEAGDWYVSEGGSIAIDFDSGDSQRQLSLLCKRDGSVRYVAYINGDKAIGDAMEPAFFDVLRRLAAPSKEAGDGFAVALLRKLIAQDVASEASCREMAERLGEKNPTHNELLRDASQYRQSAYRLGLALAAYAAPQADQQGPDTIASDTQSETSNVRNRGDSERPADRVDGGSGYGRCAAPGAGLGAHGLGAGVLHDADAGSGQDRDCAGSLAAAGVEPSDQQGASTAPVDRADYAVALATIESLRLRLGGCERALADRDEQLAALAPKDQQGASLEGDAAHGEEVAKILARHGYHAAAATVRRLASKASPDDQRQEGAELKYAQRLARFMWREHYALEAPQWEPFDDLMGVLSQIDNMLPGLMRKPMPASPPTEAAAAVGGLLALALEIESRSFRDITDDDLVRWSRQIKEAALSPTASAAREWSGE